MKNIKSFNELFGFLKKKPINIELNKKLKKEIEDFCKDNLTYLLDNDYDLIISDEFEFLMSKSESNIDDEWCYIRNEILPFLKILTQKYKLNIIFIYGLGLDLSISIDDLLNNDYLYLKDNDKIRYIRFKIDVS